MTPWKWRLTIHFVLTFCLSSLIKEPVWRHSSCCQHLCRHLQWPTIPHFVPSRKLLNHIVPHLNRTPSLSGLESITTLELQSYELQKKKALRWKHDCWTLVSQWPVTIALSNILHKHIAPWHTSVDKYHVKFWGKIRYNAQPQSVFGWRSETLCCWLLPGALYRTSRLKQNHRLFHCSLSA